jgi:hypothetical protein
VPEPASIAAAAASAFVPAVPHRIGGDGAPFGVTAIDAVIAFAVHRR